MNDNIVYSTDKEIFNYESIEECTDEFEINETVEIYEAKKYKLKISKFIDTNEILESIMVRSYDDFGEFSEDYLTDVTESDLEDLDNSICILINKWADKNNLQPNFYGVKNIKKLKVKIIDDEGHYEIIKGDENE